ncbi:lysozyme C, milk isozyme-like [Lacerta agilis]|uniref:lysozyme C, milk isozyme-like n=1 Tax=Lacerta agilis TaxID=80427 RepID=UPI00141A3EA7|nr:lysozyme C, milk isozyme-like [Lacerta agilis]
MIHLLQTLLLTCFAVTVQAKIFGRCELFHKLKVSGLDGYEGYSLANWICMSFFETGFDTEAIDRRKDGTKDYGIFHINNGWWCKDEGTLSENLCSMSCADLLNTDINDDILCVKRIVKDPQGMGTWKEWKKHCENQDLHEWVKGCKP